MEIRVRPLHATACQAHAGTKQGGDVTMASRIDYRLKGTNRDSYLRLVSEFPLASIRSDEHLAEAQGVMDRLVGVEKLDSGAGDVPRCPERSGRLLRGRSPPDRGGLGRRPASPLDGGQGGYPGRVEPGNRHSQVHHFRGAVRQAAIQSADDPQTGGLLPGRCPRPGCEPSDPIVMQRNPGSASSGRIQRLRNRSCWIFPSGVR